MGETLCTLSTTMGRIGLLDYERELLAYQQICNTFDRVTFRVLGMTLWSCTQDRGAAADGVRRGPPHTRRRSLRVPLGPPARYSQRPCPTPDPVRQR